mmetsp:Transcript_53428/g.173825  ORF Transcript_53428/g.173825 Transcript_53428/m.173825 type:complete len:376 (-) Transcript_53428:591-1718(-)
MHQMVGVDVNDPSTDPQRQGDDQGDRQLPVPAQLVGLVDEVEEGAIHQLGDDVVFPRRGVRADADEGANVGMRERCHDARLLEQLVQPHPALAPHLLHRDEHGPPAALQALQALEQGARGRCAGTPAACELQRGALEDASVDRPVPALRDLCHEREVLQWHDEPREHGVAQEVPDLVPSDAVLPPIRIHEALQGLAHDQPLNRRRENKLAPQLRVGHLQHLNRALEPPLLYPQAHLATDAQASKKGRKLVLAPKDGRPHRRRGLPVLFLTRSLRSPLAATTASAHRGGAEGAVPGLAAKESGGGGAGGRTQCRVPWVRHHLLGHPRRRPLPRHRRDLWGRDRRHCGQGAATAGAVPGAVRGAVAAAEHVADRRAW